ncbi:MAG: hypothetical protein JWQ40_5106 [Segetibacter sp.]|nr:hypothetical protein [Segetibacter sp.]
MYKGAGVVGDNAEYFLNRETKETCPYPISPNYPSRTIEADAFIFAQ